MLVPTTRTEAVGNQVKLHRLQKPNPKIQNLLETVVENLLDTYGEKSGIQTLNHHANTLPHPQQYPQSPVRFQTSPCMHLGSVGGEGPGRSGAQCGSAGQPLGRLSEGAAPGKPSPSICTPFHPKKQWIHPLAKGSSGPR